MKLKNRIQSFKVKFVDQNNDIIYKEKYILDNIKLIKYIIKNKKKIYPKNLYKFAIEVYKISQSLHHKQKISLKQNHKKKINEDLKRFIKKNFKQNFKEI